MRAVVPTLIMCATVQPRPDEMDRSELALELERLHPESWGWALACCARNLELAEDTLQTAYLRILSGRARYGGRSRIKTWVFGVIRLTALDEARRWGRRRASTDGVEAAMDVADPAPRADVLAERLEQNAAIIAALNGLSSRQREALQLVFYHGMTIEEAAAVMKVSLGSARTHYDRGKKALAQRLRPDDGR
jgi:RNA polymerase sigma factor (sigma-70 family)